GETEQAVELWKESLQESPDNERLLRNLALGCEKLEQKPEALQYWRRLLERWRHQAKNRAHDPAFKTRFVRLEQHVVELMLELDRPAHEIQDELNAALKIDPENDELRRRSADLFLEIGRPQQALKQLEAIQRHQGESADVLALKGLALDMLGRRGAKECFA